jgi:hypothetical protein
MLFRTSVSNERISSSGPSIMLLTTFGRLQ